MNSDESFPFAILILLHSKKRKKEKREKKRPNWVSSYVVHMQIYHLKVKNLEYYA